MNKNILYVGIAAVVGLLAGYLIFSGTSETSMVNKNGSEMSGEHDHSGESGEQLWTCSMHPQIMRPEPGDCPICGMDLIPAESGGEGLAINEIKMTENAIALANIKTTLVGNEMIAGDDGMLTLSGKISMNEENNAIQASYFDGRIEQLNVNYEGQEVKEGQLLATIYAPNLVAAQQELLSAASLKDSQPSLYRAVRNKLKLWKLSESQINSIEESGKVRENFPIYATVSGTVSEKMAAEGEYVKQGQPIVKVSNLNSVWAEFDAYENQIAQLQKGREIKVFTNAYPNKEFKAKISFIDPVLNTRTRTVKLRATIRNTEGLFKPGMFVRGKIRGESDSSPEQLNIPASAVMWTGERSLVYVKTKPDKPIFEMREITLGNQNGNTFTVVSGLENGEEIVVNGTFTIDAAAQLQGKKSMMNNNNGKEKEMMPSMNMDMRLPEGFQKGFVKVLDPYLMMKDAFIAGDAGEVSTYAKATLAEIQSVPKSGLGKMETSHFSQISEMLQAIADNDNLEDQRSHFVILNENIVAIVMNIEAIDSTWFVQKCPMANSNKGAVWLSKEKEIRNPYYGEQMSTCGSVIQVIQ